MTTDIQSFIFDLSRELRIEGIQGIVGNELELIALIRNCPFIYDKSRCDFKDLEKRDCAWKAIAAVMQAPVIDCQSRWKCLREQYGRIKRSIKAQHADAERMLHWEYLEDMSFLDKHIIPRRKSKLNDRAPADIDDDQEDDENYKTEWLEEYKAIDNPELKLINLVKQCPIIYSKNNFDSRDAIKKERVWISIAKRLGHSVLDCKTRWKALRERYARERKLFKDDPTRKPWEFYTDMEFLDCHIKTRRSSYRPILPKQFDSSILNSDTNVALSNNLSDSDINFHVQKLEYGDPSYQNCQLDNSNPVPMSPGSATSQSISESSRQNTSFKNQSDSSLQDEDDLFGLSVAAELRKIKGRRKKMKLKAEIFKMLAEVDSEECDDSA